MLSSDHSLTRPALREGRQSVTGPDAPARAATLLQASRRVDWRFLLPDPNLGRVAYLGPAHGTLIESLKLFSAGLTILEVAVAAGSVQYDVVVASNPSYASLRQAVELVKPEGFFYAEIQQRWRPRLSRASARPRSPADYVAALTYLGLAEIEAYWHWPNFESCAEITPLHDPAAVQQAFNRRSHWAARVKAKLGRGLLRSGGLALIIPCFSLVARQRSAA